MWCQIPWVAGTSAVAVPNVPLVISTTRRMPLIGAARISNAGTELKIHDREGRIRQSDSHGHDPHKIKG